MVDRSSISLAASAAGLTRPAALMRMVRTSSHPQRLLVEARDDPMEPGDAHADAGTADLRGEVIRDRMLLYMRPEPDYPKCCIYNTVPEGYLQHIHQREDLKHGRQRPTPAAEQGPRGHLRPRGSRIITRHQVFVITCLDPRTDLSAFLELDVCDAMVVRNAGGRVSADVLKDLAYTGYLASALVADGPQFEAAVVHHTQRGTHFLADDKFRRGFADLIGAADAALAREAVTSPDQTVRSDVELLLSATVLPNTITISGPVYEVTAGLVNQESE